MKRAHFYPQQMDTKQSNFLAITAADFIVRAAYQMGKTPLLPIFAASLGATDALLGLIVSVSTVTGMVLKPGIGLLSDKWGRRIWFFVGALFFAGVPFFYRFVETPGQLFTIRLIHGMATAIYGPVTIAYVAEQAKTRRAERIGWFGAARSGGYIVGPFVASGLLLWLSPVDIFSVIGALSLLAFIPLMLLSSQPDRKRTGSTSRNRMTKESATQQPLATQFFAAMKAVRGANAVWISGGMEGFVYITLYALRAFLPIYALASGINVLFVGSFFSVQEIVYMLVRPVGGRIGDWNGFRRTLLYGIGLLGATLIFLSWQSVAERTSAGTLLVVALLLGLSQALIFPSTIALAASQIEGEHLGAGMGIVGSLKNAGKIAGPILGGLLIGWLSYPTMLLLLGLLLWAAVGLIGLGHKRFDHIRTSFRTNAFLPKVNTLRNNTKK